MTDLEGVLTATVEGRLRIALRSEEFTSVEFDAKDVNAVRPLDSDGGTEMQRVSLAGGASVDRTPVDRTEFDTLFDGSKDWANYLSFVEARGRSATVDGSHYRCCYTVVYD